ncbi:GyrI-like domain-containing protein [Amycolatopsis suaedae]|uniref:AraC family transcriptional regulator n=1 Tax=Amycolatopsis suaedae TaxID=2510978 RepID=A0A4V2ELI6_9PSEU|nr:GyrI-like domain-containing protein [Amycolatopsis suaedae]RZQ61695.1 AraC family transcriptional regulator [Amycolatopsis suaedae]
MPNEPTIVDRPEQPYVAIEGTVGLTTFGEIADRLPEVFAFLGRRGIAPAGPPFFRYLEIDMETHLVVQAGVPVAEPLDGEGDLLAAALPSGRYVSYVHTGHPDQLFDVTDRVLGWADQEGLTWDRIPGEDGERWGCRLEILHTDPAQEPDLDKWVTELAFRLTPAQPS